MILANDNDYINFVKDKNVIIVGSAGYLMNQNKGEWINSFDIVVRINNSIPIEFPNDYGKRTDILYHILFKHANITKNKKRDTNEEDIRLYEKNNVKYLIARSSLA